MVEVYFVDDDPEGGCIVECQGCGFVFNDSEVSHCPDCLQILQYSEGASW